MIRTRAGARGSQHSAPNSRLLERYGSIYGLEPKRLATVLSEFGPLPEAGQEQLIRCLVLAFGRYQFSAKTTERVTPGKQRDLLRDVETTSRRLLLQLGINVKNAAPRAMWERLSDRPPSYQVRSVGKQTTHGAAVSLWLSLVGISTANEDSATVNAELREGSDDVANSIIGLLHLHDRAKDAAQAATKRTTPKRGGARHGPSAEGKLIRDAIAIYAHIRAEYPDSGNKPGLGEPMRRFVRAVAALLGASITDPAINEGWRNRKSNPKSI
jgi:hypothetical protein